MDMQTIELLGRNRLMDELLRAGLEVAHPARDRGIDLIAYADLDTEVESYSARPIQMKAASSSAFSIDRKYLRFPNLIIAYVWFIGDPSKLVTYALFYPEAIQVAETMGWTKTSSWEQGQYSTSQPSQKLLDLLKQHKMDSDKWWQKVVGVARPNKPLQPTPATRRRG